MHEEYRVTEHVDFQTIVNTFTQGLRELPTDYVSRVKNFLAEYLGTIHHPVPFGGRVRDFEQLNAWLSTTQATPYMLLAAPAGRGKSALLLRWCQKLLAQRNLAIAYFPVSIRFRTNLAGVAFPSLVALLASLHGEKVPTDPNLHEDVWRGLFTEYIKRPLPDGRSLLLVLDGIDEAADWSAGPDLFPLDPPPGLRIVLSARYLANDQDANAWLKRLGWTRPGLARTLELYPLDRTGIASVLMQMGFPLDLLSSRVNIVSELYRLSEGDPLLVRLYVDDLWERGEAAVRFQPEDLHTIRPGLSGYFERWWKDQRLLWSKKAPQREATAQIVLNLLAGALGPLSKKDILSLASGEMDLQAGELEQHLIPLARFVTGDGVHQGYVFSHPRLANYFLEERLSNEERQEVEQRFLTWGEQTLEALNEHSLPPEQASPYIIQYYGAHLERAQAAAPALLALVSNGWRRAWEKLDRANAGFLGDVERAWRAAERENRAAIAAGHTLPYLGDEIRCLLSQVSINSVTSNISPRLMLEAVKTNIWTPAQGLASIRLISDLAPRARELVGLAPYVQEPLRTDILQEALDTIAAINDEYARLDTLVELATGFSEELLWQVLEVIPTIEDEADRAGVLAELVSALFPSKALLERTLDLIQEMEEEEYRALALEGLAPSFSQDQHARVLQLVADIEEERYRALVLKALIPHLSESLLQDVLQKTRTMRDGLSYLRLLAELVTYLPDALQADLVQEVLALEQDIEDREYRIEVLVKLAPFLSENNLAQALQEVASLWDEGSQSRALSDLLQYMPENLLPEFQQTVLAMKNEQYRMQVLLQLIPRLSEELLEQTLNSVQATWDEGYRAELLAYIAHFASKDLVSRLLEIAATIKDQGYRVWLLAELEAPLAGKLPGTYSDMLIVFKAINNKEERLQIVLAIAPRLSEQALAKLFGLMLPEIFGFTWTVQSEERRAYILTKLASRLPEGWLTAAIDAARTMEDEVYQVQALIALAPRIGKTLLSEALNIVRAMKDKAKRAQVLEALVSSLPDTQKGERVQEMLQVLQVIKDEVQRVQFVVGHAPYLSPNLPSDRIKRVLDALTTMIDQENITRTLKALIPTIAANQLEDVLDIAQNMRNGPERALVLEALAPHIPGRLFPRMLQLLQSLENERWRTRVLTTVVAHVPEEFITGMLEVIQSNYEHIEILAALVPRAPESLFYQLWEAVQAIPSEGRRVLVLGALALRMPEGFFPQLWETIRAITNEDGQIWVLRVLAPHMSENLFQQIWEAVQAIENRGKRQSMQEILMPYVPERFFAWIWEELQDYPDGIVYNQLLEALASRVPEEFFLSFLMVAQEISNEERRGQVLEELAPHVPERYFPQFFIAARGMSYEGIRVTVLKGIIPYVPERYFPQLWKAVQAVQSRLLRPELLVALAPHVPSKFLPRFWKDIRTMVNIGTHPQILNALLPYAVEERFADVLEIVQELSYGDVLIELLTMLVPHLSEEQCAMVLKVIPSSQTKEQLFGPPTQLTWGNRQQIRALAVLAPYLSAEKSSLIITALLRAARELSGEEARAWILTKLASQIPQELLEEMLDTIWLLTMEQFRIQVLKVLLPTLSQTAWIEVLKLVSRKMHTTGDANWALEVLNATGPITQLSSSVQLYEVFHEVLRFLSQHERRETLLDLSLLAPSIRVSGNEEAIAESCSAVLEVGYWWP
jgi:hypothetical protein